MTHRVANKFVDPNYIDLGRLGIIGMPDYPWPLNHSSMQPSGRRRSITATAPTSGIGAVRQQGTETPLGLTLAGTILKEAQRSAFIQWWGLCRTQTIYFYEFSGEQYEVIIADYEEIKLPTTRNLRDPSIPLHYYTYTLVMDVISALNGPWTAVTSGL